MIAKNHKEGKMNEVRTLSVVLSAIVMLLCMSSIPAIASGSIHSEYVEYRAGDTVLEGYLAYDNTLEGARPAVMIVHEWWGLGMHPKRSAERLAKLGYVAFAIDMYGVGKLTDSVAQAAEWSGALKNDPALAIKRFEAAMVALMANAVVDSTRIAAIGYCFGGTICLEMARAGVELAGIVSFHGGLDSVLPEEKRNINAKILVCTGADDPYAPPDQVIAFEDEMRRAGADWQVISYGGAVHSFTNRDADKHGIPGVAYNEKADRRSWEAMMTFFHELFNK